MSGWISIQRSIREHWIWQDPIKLRWWLDILLSVNHATSKVNIGMQLFECRRGQSIMSLQSWADRWGVSKDTTRNFFVLLEKDGMIETENLKKTTRLTVCNYEIYQSNLHDEQTPAEREPNASQTLAGTNNKENKDNNENNENNSNTPLPPSVSTGIKIEKKVKKRSQPDALQFPFSGSEFLIAWDQLTTLPKWKNKPLSAIQKSLDQLAKYDELFAIKLIEDAHAGNWSGIVFTDTDDKFSKWKNSTNGNNQNFKRAAANPATADELAKDRV